MASAAAGKKIDRGTLGKGDRVLVVRGHDIGGVPAKRYKARVSHTARSGAQVIIDDPRYTGSEREQRVPYGQLEWDDALRAAEPAPVVALAHGGPVRRVDVRRPAAPPPPSLPPPAPPPEPEAAPEPEKSVADEVDAWLSMGKGMITDIDAQIAKQRARRDEIDTYMLSLEEERKTVEKEIDRLNALATKLKAFQ